MNEKFEKSLFCVRNSGFHNTKNLIKKYLGETDRIAVMAGGTTRNETIMNAISYIEENYEVDDDTIILTHDSVRPFVTHRIIEENIRYAQEYGACDTAVAATDTIVQSEDGKVISSVPDRSKMYQGQTPPDIPLKETEIAV